ncbi:MAG: ShlB/FhaC/HecB family hemolysin secretion/activation protein [Microcoleaceae cyanobacterium]
MFAPESQENLDLLTQAQDAPDEPTSNPESIQIFVRELNVTGSTVFTEADFNSVTQPYENRKLTLEELRQIADEITQLYINAGYITSLARPVSQTIEEGILEIRVTEGELTRIEIEGNQRVNTSYIRSRIELGATTPLNVGKLEDQLRLLRIDPLFNNIEASLRPEGEAGKSILIVRVNEASPFIANLSFDNYSPPSVGGERIGIGLGFRNIHGVGDAISASYSRTTTGGANVLDFAYSIPVNPMNGTIQLRVSPNWNEVTQDPFDDLGIRGEQIRYELNYYQPVIRNPREELILSLGFALQNGQTFAFDNIPQPFGIGPDEDGNSYTRVLQFGQDYIKRDPHGSWSMRSQFNFGLGIVSATNNDSPVPDGEFFSWLGQVQRAQLLGERHLLVIRGDLQLAADSLLPSEQLVIGGVQSVRGYRQNVRTGDSGFRFSIEDRVTITRNASGNPVIQIIPFIELGSVWNQPNNPNELLSQNFLAGTGLGLIWEPFLGIKGMSLKLDYGLPLVDLSDRRNNIQDDGIYFNINYHF